MFTVFSYDLVFWVLLCESKKKASAKKTNDKRVEGRKKYIELEWIGRQTIQLGNNSDEKKHMIR